MIDLKKDQNKITLNCFEKMIIFIELFYKDNSIYRAILSKLILKVKF